MPQLPQHIQSLQTRLQARIPAAELVASSLPDCPTLKLWLLDANYPQWQLDGEQAASLMNTPPFWSFCWASGQVLARFILDNPQLVADRRVVDFGGGSGVVAIAALKAGAKSAIVCDIDADAQLASQCNAQLNNVAISCVDSIDDIPACDVITVADVFYDRDNLPLLDQLQSRCQKMLVGDSRLKGQALDGMEIVSDSKSHTVPDLDESQEFRHVFVYQSKEYQSKST